MMWYWSNRGSHWGAWLLSGVGMVVFWGLVIWLIASLVRWNSPWRGSGPGPGTETPEAILKRRFAAGEIDADEYRHRLDVLGGRDPRRCRRVPRVKARTRHGHSAAGPGVGSLPPAPGRCERVSTLEVPGARIYYETSGNGPLLVMIPGAAGSAEPYRMLAAELAPHHQVVLYDRRGFSRTVLVGDQDYAQRLSGDADDVAAGRGSALTSPVLCHDGPPVVEAAEDRACLVVGPVPAADRGPSLWGSGQFDVLDSRQQEHATRCPMSRECPASTPAAMRPNRPGSSPACACRTLNASSTLQSSHSARMPQATLAVAERCSGQSKDIRPWATGDASAGTISNWGSRGRSVGYGQSGEAQTGTPTCGFAFRRTLLDGAAQERAE